ncbi:DEAD/DEAH box helicase family protein [Streptomyces botrytidirepellens]|uniref:DEAD/DEAH box helicase family protein n=1 Tax=Streptomyces botrytidirepellens TaxID=2486417 RepID=UPI00161971FB|nr:DEAD/DEAH box helicase family protein [Streptomyces botrytidirepellens]
MSQTVAGSPRSVAEAARGAVDECAWLYDHQPEAVAAAVRAFTPRPGSRRRRFLAQIHLAPGLGKTRIGFMVRDEVAPAGGMLFAVPTRGLLEQTYEELRAYGWQGPVIAVYGDRDARLVGREDEDVWVTTSPRQLAAHVHRFRQAGLPYTVLITYASVGTVIKAHRLSLAEDGVAPLPAWDLLVKDEAHHTEFSKVWGRINSNRLVPASCRLAMTATPRLPSMMKRDARGQLVMTPAVRMSEKVHGPVVYQMGLGEAQRRGKLAHSQVVVAEVDEERLREMAARLGPAHPEVQAELLASATGATLRAAGRYGCRRLLTYHSTVAGAMAAAETMPEQSWLLNAQGTTAPQRVFAVALHEHSPAKERAKALEALENGTDLDGNEVDLVVVCSVRVLSEGIDVPRVDAVALVEPRSMLHELLQIAGRAVRFDRDNPEKVANIIVPVLHLEGPAGDEIGQSSDWDPVTNMLRAVESYEPDGGPSSSGESTSRTRPAVTDAERQERIQQRAKERAEMVVLTRERSVRAVVDWLRFKVVNDPSEAEMLRVVEAATAFREANGHLVVPADWEESGLMLAVELDKLRRRARADKTDLVQLTEQLGGDVEEARAEWLRRGPRIHPDDIDYLAGLGFEWDPRADGRALFLAASRAYAALHGHLLPHKDETIDLGGEEIPISAMLIERRRPGTHDAGLEQIRLDLIAPFLEAGKDLQQLDAIGAWRLPPKEVAPWSAAFHRQLARLQLFKAEGGQRAELLRGPRLYRGGDLGRWLRGQHVKWKELHEPRRQALKALRMGPATGDTRISTTAVPTQRRGRAERAQELADAARQHLAEVGPLTDSAGRITVADSYRPLIGGREIQLRKRLYTMRDAFPGYPPELKAVFAGLGLPWAAPEPGKSATQPAET